jgi:hypothetical protein
MRRPILRLSFRWTMSEATHQTQRNKITVASRVSKAGGSASQRECPTIGIHTAQFNILPGAFGSAYLLSLKFSSKPICTVGDCITKRADICRKYGLMMLAEAEKLVEQSRVCNCADANLFC